MAITARDLGEKDLLQCLNIDQRRIGDGIVGRTCAISLWQWLLRCQSFAGAVFEYNPPLLGHQIVGFASGVFVAPDFVARELANPWPGLNWRIC